MAAYLILNLVVLACVTTAAGLLRFRTSRSFWLALAGLLVLTAVFDNFIVGLGIVGYDGAKILGIRLGTAPIEDFFYAVAAAIIVPAIWEKIGGGKG